VVQGVPRQKLAGGTGVRDINEVKEVKEIAPNLNPGGGWRETKTARVKILE
jgi:hypothetical protein